MPRAGITLVAGIVSALAMPPFGFLLLLFIGLSTLYLMLAQSQTMKAAFGLGFVYGLGYFVTGLWWIGNALKVEGNEDFMWVWPLAVLGLPALLAMVPALLLMALPRYFNLRHLSGFLAFIALLSLSEWVRGHVLTGFPWNLYGYGWAKNPAMIQSVSIGGIYFLTLLTIFWAVIPAFVLIWHNGRLNKSIMVMALIASMGAFLAFGTLRLNGTPTSYHDKILIRLVQPAIPQAEKWNYKFYDRNFKKLLKLSRHSEENKDKTTIIIWPETALNHHIMQSSMAQTMLKEMLIRYPGPSFLLTGMLRKEQETYYNSLVTYDQTLSPLATYNKSHLVPFGEYIPFQHLIPLKPVVQFTGFKHGNGPETYSIDGLPSFSTLVCYEILFPGAVTSKDKDRPHWIVNVTNDAWYGDSPGPYQHFAMAIFRAVEEGIPVVRAANTGISTIIDPLGRIIYKTELFEAGGVDTPLPKRLEHATLYAKVKDSLFFLLLGVTFIGAGVLRLRNREQQGTNCDRIV